MQREARWIFGYGSLVWRPDFDYLERTPAHLGGYARRFWQGSPDHRGRPGAPGRVVTLVPAPAEGCAGVAYRVSSGAWDGVLERLDERESGGFERLEVTLQLRDARRARGLVYVAAEGNPNYLGPAPAAEIARQARTSRGKSGTNADYVLRLARELGALGVEDAHVVEIAALLRTS